MSTCCKNNNLFISLDETDNFYNIYISLRGLKKHEILINYINNFLVLNFCLYNKNLTKFNYKRILYLKNLDIDTIENNICANLIYLKFTKKNRSYM